jgi:hypothetical protein
MISLLIGLVGALIGSGTTIITLWLKEKWSYKREIRKLALEMARSDYDGQVEICRNHPNFVTPLPVLVNYYLKLIDHVEKNSVNEELFKVLAKERHDLRQADIY